jgi:hypothetical protein
MSESARTRRVIALAAAYVVALQALLLPLSVVATSYCRLSAYRMQRHCAAAVDRGRHAAGH